MKTRPDLIAFFDAHAIDHTTIDHPAVFRVGEGEDIKEGIPGAHTKNLFLKDAKGRLWLISAQDDTQIDLKRLHTVIGSARLSFGSAELMEQGGDVALLAVGSMVAEAIEVRDLLEKRGIHASLVNCRSVKPMDEKMLCQLANRPIVTMEEHVLTGGFGSVVCAFLSGEGLPAPMLSFGIPDTFVQHGRRDQLLKYLGLTPELMTQRIVIALKNGEKHQ